MRGKLCLDNDQYGLTEMNMFFSVRENSAAFANSTSLILCIPAKVTAGDGCVRRDEDAQFKPDPMRTTQNFPKFPNPNYSPVPIHRKEDYSQWYGQFTLPADVRIKLFEMGLRHSLHNCLSSDQRDYCGRSRRGHENWRGVGGMLVACATGVSLLDLDYIPNSEVALFVSN